MRVAGTTPAISDARLGGAPKERTILDAESLHAALAELARNHRWSWAPPTRSIFEALGPGDTLTRHPVEMVADLTRAQLEQALDDHRLIDAIGSELSALRSTLGAVTEPEIAYFSPEFGISELVPQYSGGLGILAGDHLKSASDLGLALCGVGLFYRQGFFSQVLTDTGQGESYHHYMAQDFGCIDTGHVVSVAFPGRDVAAKIWRFDVGSVALILLDTDIDQNSPADRAITDRLYSGDRRHRLEQELILGVGGSRALAALGWQVRVHHLNEGHAGFLLLDLIDRQISTGATLAQAISTVSPGVVFTTHTPVPAGIDRFEPGLASDYLQHWADRWQVEMAELFALATDPSASQAEFNMAALCLRVAGRANGVSELHGRVSRSLFRAVPGGDAISSITNGVHARTWVMPELATLFDRSLGAGWSQGHAAPWSLVDDIDSDTIRSIRRTGAVRLGSMVTERTGVALDPDALTIGFARRFATYKRATLLLQRAAELQALLADDDRPIQFVFAGKAHPADVPGKALLAEIVTYSRSAPANSRFVFVPDYDIGVAQAMYAGCDVWLNNPVRPREASGTSGEKSALNGGLNCSISDGWWDEMADGRNGWTIPSSGSEHPQDRDLAEADSALAIISREILAEYYAQDRPWSDPWIDRIRDCWRSLGPRVTAGRMVADYRDQLYEPARRDSAKR